MKKDAKYYLSRTNDLPYFMVDNLKELKQQINQTRYIYTTPRDLIQRLELETDLVDFSNNTSSVYLDLNTLLETYGMKLVPGFIPCDIKFDDRIQVTIKPNLNNDEDFSYVQELIKSKRVPTQKDASYIARMSTKIANYNIMLRVFESLHVISKTIDSHLRLELDNILNSLSLPKEGYNYLKTCYSFACLNLNYKCDYQNQNLCFKQLDNKNHLRFISIMAKLAIYNGENFSVDREFPYYDTLLLEIAHQKNLIKEKEKQSKIQAFKDKEFKEHLRARVEAIAKLDEIDKKKSSTGIIISKQQTHDIFQTHKKEDVLFERRAQIENYAHKKETEKQTRTKEYRYFESNSYYPIVSMHENFYFVSKFEYLSVYSRSSLIPYLSIPFITNQNNKEYGKKLSDIISNKSNISKSSFLSSYFFTALSNSKLPNAFINTLKDLCYGIKIEKRQESETAIPSDNVISSDLNYLHEVFTCIIPNHNRINFTTRRMTLGISNNSTESRLYAIQYFYLLVTLKQIVNPSSESEITAYRNELNSIYQKTEDSTLLFIKLLDFLFLRLPCLLEDEKISIDQVIYQDDDLLLGFYSYPQCIELAINIILANRNINKISDSDISSLFSLMLILLEKENSSNRASLIRVPNRKYIFRISLFIKLFRDNLYKFEKFCSFVSNENSKGQMIESFSSFSGINVSYNDSLAAYLVSHESFSYLFSPLLNHSTLEKISSSRIEFDLNGCMELSKSILNQYKNFINVIMDANSPDLSLRLISNTLEMKEQLDLIGKLNDLSFDNLITVIHLVDPNGRAAVASCIEKGILNLGLMAVPIEHALSAKERCNLVHHKIIQTETDNTDSKVLTDEFYEKLACAQNALIIYCYIVVENAAEKTLVKLLELENEEQEKLAMKFFVCLKQLVRGNQRYTSSYYARLAKAKETSKTAEKTVHYLNLLITEEMKTHPLASYFTKIFKETLKPLLSEFIYDKGSSFATKKKKLTVDDFDESKISSKIIESNHIQNVIEAIRISEGSLKDDEVFEPENEGSDNTDDSLAQSNLSVTKLPSSNARTLVDSLVNSGCDVMDLDEFNGLCLSAKYMSKDVAIEEINDYCYEEFDEPLLDVDYEGNTVYITLDILNQMKD